MPLLFPTLDYEDQFGRAKGLLIAGVDEVGRGPLAGPVVACAVILPADLSVLPLGITDSKKLTPKRRAAMATVLQSVCTYALGEASVDEIDRLNILQATFLAMQRALAALPITPQHILIDGNRLPKNLPAPATAIVSGDAKCLSIAAASIIAKEARDQLMTRLAADYPAYGWQSNAGYGSAGHLAALEAKGMTPHHRRSFAPLREWLAEGKVAAVA